jgi:hypothetical protein
VWIKLQICYVHVCNDTGIRQDAIRCALLPRTESDAAHMVHLTLKNTTIELSTLIMSIV